MNKKVVLITVSFNQKEVTLKTIEKIRQQTLVPDIIYVDNASTDGAAEFLAERFSDLIILKTKQNYGNSGGQYIACRYAVEKGYEYIILSDNDALPVSENMIEKLVENASENIVTQPWNIDEDFPEYNSFWPMHFGCYHRLVFEKIGHPLFEFFIYGDDLEFSLRLRKFKIEIKKLQSVAYSHPMKRTFSPSRFYFAIRNTLFASRLYDSDLRFIRQFFLYLNSIFIYKLIKEDNYYKFGILAVKDFLKGIYRNDVIKSEGSINKEIVSLVIREFLEKFQYAYINIHPKSNAILNFSNNKFLKKKDLSDLFSFFNCEAIILESLVSNTSLCYGFFFKKIICIDSIEDGRVYFREFITKNVLIKSVHLMFYNLKGIIFLAMSIFFYKKSNVNNLKFDKLELDNFLVK